MRSLLEPLPVLYIDAEEAVAVTHGNGRPTWIELPLDAYDLFLGAIQICDVGDCDVARNLLFEGQAGFGQVVDAGQRGVDFHAAGAEEALQAVGELLGNGFAEEPPAPGVAEYGGAGRKLRGRSQRGWIASHGQQGNNFRRWQGRV